MQICVRLQYSHAKLHFVSLSIKCDTKVGFVKIKKLNHVLVCFFEVHEVIVHQHISTFVMFNFLSISRDFTFISS